MVLPAIRIGYAFQLDPLYRRVHELDPAFAARPYPTEDEIERTVVGYRAEWEKDGARLLKGMCKKLKLRFRKNIIDVFVVGGARAQSTPIIIPSRYPPDEFVDVLTHELLHNLLAEHEEEGDISNIVDERFPYEWRLTKNHILVHAVHAYLFLEVLNDPARLTRDVEASARFPPAYKRAWDIVSERTYTQLIADFVGHPDWPSRRVDQGG
jgi:hypothetical protein